MLRISLQLMLGFVKIFLINGSVVFDEKRG